MRRRLLGFLWTLGLILIGAGHLGARSASAQGGGCCPAPFLHAEYLYMRTNVTATPYAASVDDPILIQQADLESVSFDWDSGFSVGAGYLMSNCMDVDFTYTHFVNGGQSQAGDPGQDFAAPNVVNLLFVNNGRVGAYDGATETVRLTYQLYDLTVGRYFEPTDGLVLRAFGGIRGAEAYYTSDALFTDNLGPNVAASTDRLIRQVNMDGVGLRLGGEGHVSLWDTGFSLVGRAAGSMVFGDFNVTNRLELFNGLNVADTRFQYEQVIPVVEMRLGARYDAGPFYVTASYQFTTWFDYYRNISLAGGPATTSGNLFLDGISLEAGFIW